MKETSKSSAAQSDAAISGEGWQVKAANAVGVISVEGLQIVVRPKIPMRHLLYLLVRCKLNPSSAGAIREIVRNSKST